MLDLKSDDELEQININNEIEFMNINNMPFSPNYSPNIESRSFTQQSSVLKSKDTDSLDMADISQYPTDG